MNENTAPRLTAEELKEVKSLPLKRSDHSPSDVILIGRYMRILGLVRLTANRGIVAYLEVYTKRILWTIGDRDTGDFDITIGDLFSSNLSLFCRDAVNEMQKGEFNWKQMWGDLEDVVRVASILGVE